MPPGKDNFGFNVGTTSVHVTQAYKPGEQPKITLKDGDREVNLVVATEDSGGVHVKLAEPFLEKV